MGRPDPSRQLLGGKAERLAIELLKSSGYVIQQRNVRSPLGEIDLIGWDGPTLCFVEVRSTSSDDQGGPLATISRIKRRHVIRSAQWYLSQHASLRQQPMRFDVVGITWRPEGPSVELIRGAFDATGYW